MNDQFETEEEKEIPLKFWGSRSFMFIFYDHWFRVAIIGFLLLLIFLGLFLPKIWTATPPGHTPVVKISGLDKFQAWSLQRTARQAAAKNRLSDSMVAWLSALANNPADPDLNRGVLQTLLDQPLPPREYLAFAVRRCFKLMELTSTNPADLSLSAKVFSKFDLHGLVVNRLGASRQPLGRDDTALLMKSVFHAGQMNRFGKMWTTNSTLLQGNPELELYHAAWLAGWGPPGSVGGGRKALDLAKEKQATRVLANRLELSVSASQHDLPGYKAALEELRSGQADTVGENVALWRLLAISGRKDEAIQLARAFSNPPASPADALEVSRMYFELGLVDDSIDFLDKRLADPNFNWNHDLYIEQATHLIQAKRWDDLRGLAIQIRSNELIREAMGGFAYYLEGLSQFGMNRLDLAKDAFTKVPTQGFSDPELAFRSATTMNRLGYYVPARELLMRFESGYTNKAKFYAQLTTAAFESKQMDVLIPAAEKAHQLDPDNIDYANNYAAALLTLRENPGEAIKITLRLLALTPGSIPRQINHAAALLQNLRLDEAEAILRSIDTTRLRPAEAAALNYAWFELYASRGRGHLAREARARIDVRYLLPPQEKWLQETLQKLPTNS